MQSLKDYIINTFGSSSNLKFEKANTEKLPLYLKAGYNIYTGHIEGIKILWVEPKGGNLLTPEQLKKQGYLLQEFFNDLPVVFVFQHLEAWQRKRLIEKKIAFAEPFRQLYIPLLYTQIREGKATPENIMLNATSKFKPPTQVLLFYHLQKQNLEGLMFQEIARLLNYSPMTITRSIKELEASQLITIRGDGKEKTIFFTQKGMSLWIKALPFLKSPVRETWYIDNPLKSEYTALGGEAALAQYSMLSIPGQQTFVIGKDAYRTTKSTYDNADKKFGTYLFEVWHYDPMLLTNTGVADKLSLYLTLKEHDDERIQGALQRMINEMTWL